MIASNSQAGNPNLILVRLDYTTAVWRTSRCIFKLQYVQRCTSAAGCQDLSRQLPRCTPIMVPSATRIRGNPQMPHGRLANKPSLRTGKQAPTRPGDHERHITCINWEQAAKSVYLMATLPQNDVHCRRSIPYVPRTRLSVVRSKNPSGLSQLVCLLPRFEQAGSLEGLTLAHYLRLLSFILSVHAYSLTKILRRYGNGQ